MANELWIVVVMVVASAWAMPPLSRQVPADKMDVNDVLNKTVCPIKIRIDDDRNRIPRRIKVMECRENSNEWCAKKNVPPNECCQHRHDKVVMRCVEIQDHVQVFYKESNETQTLRVSVGCMCMMQESTEAQESSPS